MVEYLELCCPKCKGSLRQNEKEYLCLECKSEYPIVLGIPDFRVFPDPYIDFEDDHNKAKYLVDQARDLDFQGMVKLYWSITPEVSKDRSARFMRRTFALVDKGIENLREIEEITSNYRPINSNCVLEIGCGTGGFLVAAKRGFENVVGMDIAFRWLVIARKRLDELNLKIPLVCCCAEFMPFRKGRFDLIVAEAVLEHVHDQEMTLRECNRVLRDQGALFLATPNRFSITPEPHVRVWGVGFMPRKWMNGYVRWRRGISYDQLRVLSVFELKRLFNRCSFTDHRILLPSVSKEEMKEFSAFEKLQVAIYDVIRKLPLVRLVLYLFGPFYHIICYAGGSRMKEGRR